MKTVKSYPEWCRYDGRFVSESAREVWDAAQANKPEKTCKWTEFDEGYINCADSGRGTKTPHTDAFRITATAYCDNCGGKVTIKPRLTTEQKLEAMKIERDRQRARANGALFDLRQAEKHLDELVNRAASTNTCADKELDMLNYIHKNELDK